MFARAIEGDVLKIVAANLPEGVSLIARASRVAAVQPMAERKDEASVLEADKGVEDDPPPPS
jgi:hypothetical protein